MEFFSSIIDGLWSNVLNRTVHFDSYSFKLWVPSAFGFVIALVVRFLGGGKHE